MRVTAVVVLAGLAGCDFRLEGSQPFDADPDAAPAIDMAIASDTAPPTCLDRWHAGTVRFDTPVPVPGVPTSGMQHEPFVSADERLISFAWDGQVSLDDDLYLAGRSDPAEAFSTAAMMASLSSGGDEGKGASSFDALSVVVASDRFGGEGDWDLWMASRASAGAPYPSLSQAKLANVNTPAREADPHLTDDATRLYLSRSGSLQLSVRSNADASWGSTQAVPGIDLPGSNRDPTLSPDETILVFTSDAVSVTGPTGTNLWFATRADRDAELGMQRLVPDLNSNDLDEDAHLSRDGCRIYFASTRGGSADLFVASMSSL